MTKLLKDKSKAYYGSDWILIDQPVSDKSRSDAVSMLKKDRRPKLNVDIDITHSGVLTNHRVYPSRFVSRGYRTFFSKKNGGDAEFDKPVLTHHAQDSSDPIGRIYNAKYTALKVGPDFDRDFLNPDKTGGRGSGVVTISARISEPEAIEKILDGRFLSVSAGHSTTEMFCSVCGEDMGIRMFGIFPTDEDGCNHIPGKIYSPDGEDEAKITDGGVPCYAITGPMTYHEASFVNMPAQPPAKLVNYNWEDSENKDTAMVSLVRGKKEYVRSMTLCDEDLEFNLLAGKEKSTSQKIAVVVPPSAAEKLTQLICSEEDQDVALALKGLSASSATNHNLGAESNNDQHTKDKSVKNGNSGITKAEHQKDDKSNSDSKESRKMDDKDKNDDALEAKDLRASVSALTDKCDSLTNELSTAKEELTKLKAALEGKDSEITRLTGDLAQLHDEMRKHLATAVASLRVRLKKPDTTGIDSTETYEAYVEKLTSRSEESLRDSITDLTLELEETDDSVSDKDKDRKSASDIVGKDRVESPGLSNDKSIKKADRLSKVLE